MALVVPTQLRPSNTNNDGTPLTGPRVGIISARFATGGAGNSGWNFANQPGGNLNNTTALKSQNQAVVTGYNRFTVYLRLSATVTAGQMLLGVEHYDPLLTGSVMFQDGPFSFSDTKPTYGAFTGYTHTNFTIVCTFGVNSTNIPDRGFGVIGLYLINNSGSTQTLNSIVTVCSS